MFKLIGFTFKLALLAALILILGNWIEWKGRTISDHVGSQMAHARRAVDGAWEKGQRAVEGVEEKSLSVRKESEQILQSERQKLRDLIRELNGKRGAEIRQADRE